MAALIAVLRHMWQCPRCGAWYVADTNAGSCGGC